MLFVPYEYRSLHHKIQTNSSRCRAGLTSAMFTSSLGLRPVLCLTVSAVHYYGGKPNRYVGARCSPIVLHIGERDGPALWTSPESLPPGPPRKFCTPMRAAARTASRLTKPSKSKRRRRHTRRLTMTAITKMTPRSREVGSPGQEAQGCARGCSCGG